MIDAHLIEAIEPNLERAYEEHMQSIASKNPNEPTRRPFSPVLQLATVAGTEPDPLEYGSVLRDEHQHHVTTFGETYGVDIRPVLAAAFLVNLLTEDNLPHYTSRIHSKVNISPALSEFANEWTAEEDVHGVIMRDYALLTGLIGDSDLSLISIADYDAGRISQLRAGTEIDPPSLQNAFAYLTLQEHLTKAAHNKLSWLLSVAGRKVMRPISGDEQNHYEFYRKASGAALDEDPDGTLTAMEAVYTRFSMPGALGIPGFDVRAAEIGISGVFDLETIARSKQTIVEKLAIEAAEPQTENAKRAQAKLIDQTSNEAVAAQRQIMERFRDTQSERLENGLAPFVLGKTIDFTYAGATQHQRITGIQAVAN